MQAANEREPDGVAPEPGVDGRRRRVLAELLAGFELAGLAAFAFSRPVLDSFGRSPETFIAQQATRSDIIWFGLLVALIPAVLAVLVGVLIRWLAGRHRLLAQSALVGLLAGVGAWRMGQDQTGWPGTANKLVLLGVCVALLAGFLRWWPRVHEAWATFLRYGAVAVVVFMVQFLAGSPASELAFGTAPVVNVAVAADVADALGDDPPSVLIVVFDALPTMTLLDGEGSIDGDLYPNFRGLADDATFYRNHTTVSPYTLQAVPALLTGQNPEPGGGGLLRNDPDNLFTLLAGNYNLHVNEPLTRMCSVDICPVTGGSGVSPLLDEAMRWWLGGLDDPEERRFDLEAATHSGRYRDAANWIDGLAMGATPRPDLTFTHIVLPHTPWFFTDEGEQYDDEDPSTGSGFGVWSDAGREVGEQRHVLMTQAADRLLGELLDEVRRRGAYDDTMVIVTADHGAAFTADAPGRALAEQNVAEILWVPLLVKLPHQVDGATDDTNVELIDVFPTITDVLGIDVPWEIDGYPLAAAGDQRGSTITVSPGAADLLQPEPGEDFIYLDADDYLDEVVGYSPATGQGPDGAWKLTEHGELFGEEVAGLERAGDSAGEVVVHSSEDFGNVVTSEPLQLEVVATTDLPEGEVVAFALNGTIGALGEVHAWLDDPAPLVHGLLPPRLFDDGENELTAHLVEGEPGNEVLHPLTLSFD